jgi:subtilase family serine protease
MKRKSISRMERFCRRSLSLLALVALLTLVPSPTIAQPSASSATSTRAVPLILDPIDESNRVVLPGSTRPEVRRRDFDRGPLDDSFPLDGMQLQLKRSPEHEQAAEALADELERKGSARFHQWLTAEQYAEQFGVATEDIVKISEWLRTHGFTVHASPSRMTIDFSGTAGQVHEAFGTEIHALDVKGVRHIANVHNPSIPAALAPAIEGIVSLNDFRPHPTAGPKAQYTITDNGSTSWAVVPADLATIYDFNPLFALGITGQGQTIALIEDSDVYTANDWQTFRQTFGLNAYPGGSFTTVHPGGCPDPGINSYGDDFEAILDAEWASAAAPSADLILATCADTATVYGGLTAVQNLVNQRNVPAIVSFSYQNCESYNGAASNAAYKAAYLQAVLEGVSVFVAAGDTGAANCDNNYTEPADNGVAVNAFASTAYNVAVGGTDFGDTYAGTNANYWSPNNGPTYGSALSYVPEIPWSQNCASTLAASYLGFSTTYGANGLCASAIGQQFIDDIGGGGGPSNCATGASAGGIVDGDPVMPANGTCRGYKKPSWQNVLGNPQDGVRDLPDVSLFASEGFWGHYYVICFSDTANGGTPCVGAPSNWTGAGGTSFAAPIMAGMQALVNEVWGGRQGNPDPIYYSLANQEYGSRGNKACQTFAAGGPAWYCTFYDITVAGNEVTCIGPYNCFDPDANQGVVGVLSLSDKSYQPAFTAGVGWDFTTGIGSVNATNLVLNPIWLFGW